MTVALSPISIPKGSSLFNRSVWDLNGQFCNFFQTDDTGNGLEVEGFFEDPGIIARDEGYITFRLPGDDKQSYINTSQGRVRIGPLGHAEILHEESLNGQPHEPIQIGSDDQPANLAEINSRLAELKLEQAYRIRARVNGKTEIYTGKPSFPVQGVILLTLNSGSTRRLYPDCISQLNIRPLADVRIF